MRGLMGGASGLAYLPAIHASQVSAAAPPVSRWPIGRICPGEPVPDYCAENDNGILPPEPIPTFA
jgi:hypothetical protein